jgi:Subtilase family/PatG C-terminal
MNAMGDFAGHTSDQIVDFTAWSTIPFILGSAEKILKITPMDPLDLVKLTALMERTAGSPEVKIDGPVVTQHVDLASENLREIPGANGATCAQAKSAACLHGTFVAGILSAKRNSPAPAICPNCTLLIRPIFTEAASGRDPMPSATPQELATAFIACIDSGARVINLSLALAQPSAKGEGALEEVLNEAVRRGVIVVAAAGNQGTIGSTAITHHPWVIPVVACDLRGRPMSESNLGSSMDCIFSYTNRNTDYTEKYFVRGDVTEEFPFLVTKLSPYYDR